MKHALVRTLATALTAALFLVAVGVGALAATVKARGGEWRMPNRQDVRHVVRVFERAEPRPAKTIYLHRGALELHGGWDDAKSLTTSLVPDGQSVRMPAYKASNKNWNRLMTCVADKFEAYDVAVTDELPTSGDYVLVKVGGKQSHLGIKGGAIAGIAPYNGEPIESPIVFAFDQKGRYRTKNNCETIAHEVGHVYGLDHTQECKDLMSYRHGCGKKSFVNKIMTCGEKDERECSSAPLDASPHQNSHQHLLEVLGPRQRDAVPRV